MEPQKSLIMGLVTRKTKRLKGWNFQFHIEKGCGEAAD